MSVISPKQGLSEQCFLLSTSKKKGRVTHRHDWTWAFGWQSFQWASGISTMTSRWLLVMNGDVIKWAISPGTGFDWIPSEQRYTKRIGKAWKRYEQMHFPRHEWMFIQICFIHLMAAMPFYPDNANVGEFQKVTQNQHDATLTPRLSTSDASKRHQDTRLKMSRRNSPSCLLPATGLH